MLHLVLLALSMATNAKRLFLFHSITARIYSHGSDSPDFLLNEQSQPLPKWQIFLTLKHFVPLCWICSAVSLVLGTAVLGKSSQVCPHLCLGEGEEGTLPPTCCQSFPRLVQDTFGLLFCKNTLLLNFLKEHWVLLGRAAFQPAAL